jgi:hypothetical protein
MKQDHFLLTLAGALLAGGCASVAPVNVPETLQPAANESLAMTVAARGVQIYECRPAKGGATHEWVFIAPEAQLFNESGRAIGRHGAGPFWQASDGSRVVGSLKARADAPVSGAIPWLLLATKSTGRVGAFSNITSIQRVNTVDGLAPDTSCSPGQSARVPYTADYRLFAAH